MIQAVADRIWIVDDTHQMRGVALPVRMTVVALSDGGLLLHSPVHHSPALAEALGRLGKIRHLVAPNIVHWTMLAEWQRAVPDATTWAVPNLRRRGPVRRAGVRIDRDLSDAAPPEWRDDLDQLIIPGAAGFQEAAMFHRASRTLILVDVVQNLAPETVPKWFRPLGRLLGVASHDGRAPVYVRLIVRLGGGPARAAGQRLLDWAPERVIFAHGDWFERDGAAQLARSLSWLE